MAGSRNGERDRESHYRRAALSHPLRQRIARFFVQGEEAGVARLSAELEEPVARIAYHLRLLLRRGVLRVVPKRRPNPPLYRWSADAQWAKEMLAGEGD